MRVLDLRITIFLFRSKIRIYIMQMTVFVENLTVLPVSIPVVKSILIVRNVAGASPPYGPHKDARGRAGRSYIMMQQHGGIGGLEAPSSRNWGMHA